MCEITLNNNPTNILNNLCTGLKTFLGFNPSSKGYDGTGIVYSDLDRLCDGVMGFLSGVLSNIQGNLGQHKETITPVIKLLDTNKHAGKNGFSVAIGKVVKGVGGYNKGVKKSNASVQNAINELCNYMKKIPAAVATYNDHNNISQIDSKVEECIQKAEQYCRDMDTQKNNNIKDLRNEIENDVNHATDIIRYQRERLSAIYKQQKGDLLAQMELVGIQLNLADNLINETAEKKIGEFANGIYVKIEELKQKITEVDGWLAQYVDELRKWMEKAAAVVDEALTKVTEVVKEASGSDGKRNKDDVILAVEKLKDKALALYKAYEVAKSALGSLVKNVTDAVGGLDVKIQRDLQVLKKSIQEIIEKYVKEAQDCFTLIKYNVGDNGKGGVMKNWKGLKEKIKQLVEGLTKKGPAKQGKLQQIVQNVGKYAGHFTDKHAFEAIVEGWIVDILKHDPVNAWIGKYVVSDNQHNAIKGAYKKQDRDESLGGALYYKALIGKISEVIVEMIKKGTDIIDESVQMAQSPTGETEIARHVDRVHVICITFAEKLQQKIKQDVTKYNDTFADKITKEVEQGDSGILTNARESSKNKYLLTNAVQLTLYQLLGVAKGISLEIPSFIGDSEEDDGDEEYNLGNNLEGAIADIIEFGRQTNGAADSLYGNKIETELGVVKNKIKELSTLLSSDYLRGEIGVQLENYLSNPDKFRKQMAEYVVQIGEKSHGAEQQTVYGKVRKLGNEVLQPIQLAVETEQANANEITRSANEIVHGTLQSLCNAIIQAADSDFDSAKAKLNKIKALISTKTADIPETLRKLRDDLNALQSIQLHPLIATTGSINAFVKSECSDLISQLNTFVTEQVGGAKNAITEIMQTKYVVFMKLQLQEFATKTINELDGLPTEIEKDGEKRIKGFMNVFQTALESSRLVTYVPEDGDVSTLVFNAKPFFTDFFDRLNTNTDIMPADYISKFSNAFHALLTGLTKYDSNFKNNLSSVATLLSLIRPASYAEESNPLLECLKTGVQALHDELAKAYVSVYDSETFGAELVEKDKLTPYGTQLSKVFMSIFEMMHEDLSYLKNQCISKWHNRRIYSGSSMGTFLSNCGYTVSNHDSHQNGELRNKAECDGKHIYSTLVGGFSHVYNSREDTKNAFQNLYDYLPTYYRVCQLPTFSSTRRPCSIYEMLRWLSGLPYNAVYLDLMSDDFADLFDKPKEAKTESISLDGISLEDQTPNTLNAYPQKIKRSDLHDAITHITSLAPTVLTTVVGYGDAYSMYAVDYYCNAPSFVYPSSAADCLTMLIELLRRLLPVFRFLHNRCRNMASEYGWYQCRYGTTIDSSNWHCSDHSKTKVDCQPTSPLMSYLKDSLPGHLPHHVTNVDCKSSCSTCPKNLPGQPCLTPLGFRGFSGSTKTGKDICNVLTKFFANAHLTTLLCVIPKPPSTLPEHFEFTLSLTKGWHSKIVPLPLTWVKECIKEQSIALYNDTAQLTNALSNAYNSNHGGNGERHPAAERADPISLSM
ncbi:hypothetical protein, conserved, partial [Babesia bigemina]